MKENSLRVLLALGLLLVLVSLGRAQTLDSCVVAVPFDFVVSGTKLPAGSYRIDRAWSDNPAVLIFRSADGKATASATSRMGAGLTADLKLVFNRYGEEYFLREVRTLAGVHQFLAGRIEKKLAKSQDHNTVLVVGAN